MTQTTLDVPDITCDHCERVITNALEPVDGIQGVAVDIPAKQVRVEFDADRVDLDRIKAILDDEYYPVASVASVDGAMANERTPMATAATTVDPVCGMSVDPRTARFSAGHAGQTFYFCSPGCQRSFEADPQRYLAADNREPSGGCSCCAPRS